MENKLRHSKKQDPVKTLSSTLFLFAKEFGWTYDDFINTPMPVIFMMQEELNSFYKKQQVAAKKRR